MYIGGTDEKALHHLFAEVIDNAMDEALAGQADWIDVKLTADGFVTVTDNGRGIPVDPHPKFPKKSALEVIMCTLHAGGKFDSKVYETSGRPARRRRIGGERAVRAHGGRGRARRQALRDGVRAGHPAGQAEGNGPHAEPARHLGALQADAKIFGAKAAFKPARLFKMSRSKAYLFGGVKITGSAPRNCCSASMTCRSRRRSISSAG
jgi:topoisomerase-4 subunit B